MCEGGAHGCRRLSYEELRAPLADGAALIVLVNANVLRHARRGLPIYDGLEYGGTHTKIYARQNRRLSGVRAHKGRTGFGQRACLGHFIVLTGYRTDTDAFVYWDPSRAVDPNLPPDVPLGRVPPLQTQLVRSSLLCR